MKTKRLSYGFSSFIIATASVFSVLGTALPASALDQDCTWTGATNNNFANAGNWSGCGGGAPGTGDNLVFGAASLTADQTLNNNIDNLSVKTITFQGNSDSYYNYDITGNELTITAGIVSNGTGGHAISAPLVLTGAITLGGNKSSYLNIVGALSGTGTVAWNNDAVFIDGTSTYDGEVTFNPGSYTIYPQAFPASTTLNVVDGASVHLGNCYAEGSTPLAGSLVLTGEPFSSTYSDVTYVSPKVTFGVGCGGGAGTEEWYGQYISNSQEYNLTGSITLANDVTIASVAKKTTISGTINGAHKLNIDDEYGGTIVINSSDNNSQTPNGTYTPPKITKTLSDDQSATSLSVGNNAEITLTGKRGDTFVSRGGVLKGTGSVAMLEVGDGGKVAPGMSPGCLTSGDLTLAGTYAFEIGGVEACSGYDQLIVNGTVTLGSTTSVFETSRYNSYTPTQGQVFVIIDNDGNDAVSDTFKDLAEGATFEQNGVVFKISYVGGTGNDVTLTVQNVPTAPDTGFALIKSNPVITLLVTIAGAASLMVIARRMKSTR